MQLLARSYRQPIDALLKSKLLKFKKKNVLVILFYVFKGECLSNGECPDNKACINYQCVNPCIGKCGSGAECEPKAHLAVCKCPPGTSGDALVSCRQSRTYPVAKYHGVSSGSCSVC